MLSCYIICRVCFTILMSKQVMNEWMLNFASSDLLLDELLRITLKITISISICIKPLGAQLCKFWSVPDELLGEKKAKAKEELSLGANSDWTLMNAIGRSCTVCHSDFPTKGTKGWKLVQIHPKNLFKMRSSGLKLQLRSGGTGFWFMVVQTWCPYIFHPSLSFPTFLGWCYKTFFPQTGI